VNFSLLLEYNKAPVFKSKSDLKAGASRPPEMTNVKQKSLLPQVSGKRLHGPIGSIKLLGAILTCLACNVNGLL